MAPLSGPPRLGAALAALLVVFGGAPFAGGQSLVRFGPLPAPQLEELAVASQRQLENADRLLASGQWAEGVEAIRRVQEGADRGLVKVGSNATGFERYITAGEFCQWRLLQLAEQAPAALAHYRAQIDPLAENWLRQSERDHDEAPLQRIVAVALASSVGDEALLRLGDLAFRRGDHVAARGAWQRISPIFTVASAQAGSFRAPAGCPLWLPLRRVAATTYGQQLAGLLLAPRAATPGIYPDPDIELAAVLSRLVLVSLLEGSRERATIELSLLKLLFPEARGTLAGQEGRYVELVDRIFQDSAEWPAPKISPDWPTFAGDAKRGKVSLSELAIAARPLWTFPLPRLNADREVISGGRLIPGDDRRGLLCYFPIVADGKVFVSYDAQGRSFVTALDLHSGQQLWQVDQERGFADPESSELASQAAKTTNDAHAGLWQHLGVARYSLTMEEGRLLARLGSPLTVVSPRRRATLTAKEQGVLLGLDVATQGKPLDGFPLRPPGNDWTFDGTPLMHDGTVYTVMRRASGPQMQLELAAIALEGRTTSSVSGEEDWPAGLRLRWRCRVCSAAPLGGGDVDEISHTLLTRGGNCLYLNTNAGVVAAVHADSGQLRWLIKYPRSARSADGLNLPRRLSRDLVPCLAWKDLLFAAPADGDQIFALDAATGQVRWTSQPGAADDALHLLGVSGEHLIAGGDHLYWFDAHTGQLLTQFPYAALGGAEQAARAPRGLGRGLLAGENIWWPTRENIWVFAAQPQATEFGPAPRLVRQTPLASSGVTGGNLVRADGVLLIATADQLTAFASQPPSDPSRP